MNPRQFGAPIALIVAGFLFSIAAQYFTQFTSQLFLAIGVVAAGVVLLAATPQKGASLGPLVDALRAAARGKRPRLPEGATGELAEAYDQVRQLAEHNTELDEEVERLKKDKGKSQVDLGPLVEAMQAASRGKRPRVPDDVGGDLGEAFTEVVRFAKSRAELMEQIEDLEKSRDAAPSMDTQGIVEAIARVGRGERVRPPSGAPPELSAMYAELAALGERVAEAELREKTRRSDLAQAASALEDVFPRLSDGVANVLQASEQATGHIREMTTALSNIAQSIETLASSAEESSSSILEMTATNDETAENVGELASSVRETVSSIEEMAYSIREVAKNVDALSLTAEETSSSMNEMDVSIDQVQSNANETARLSEEVATDAEKGAEAILKTIGEIYRIKESSQEAVSVISNLGFRIEAIGQILQVIDEVAEQTNLLALNAAIIAAQAGEHGKGFAVVADEIKDLAERAGGSTKEIAELIKTIQAESRNAIAAVERGAQNVDRGVEVSNEAERALKKILESSQKSTNMVRAIARATVEQAKGSKQVTDAIGRIAETVQQIAAATAEQARGSELIMKSAEKMRTITQHVERSSQEQARGGRQITSAIEQISNMVNSLNGAQRTQIRGSEQLVDTARRIEESARMQEQAVRQLVSATERLRRAVA